MIVTKINILGNKLHFLYVFRFLLIIFSAFNGCDVLLPFFSERDVREVEERTLPPPGFGGSSNTLPDDVHRSVPATSQQPSAWMW